MAAALTCAVILAVLCFLKLAIILGAFLPPGETEWWGIHQFSDFLSMLGGKRFAEEGFLGHYLLMNTTVGPHELARGWQYYQVPQLTHNSAIYYTHYGSLDAILAGITVKLAGWYSLRPLYVLFAIGSFASLGLWTVAVRMQFGWLVAVVSLALIAPSVFFFTVAESATAEALSWSLTLLFLAAFTFAERAPLSPALKRTLYGIVWVCGFLQANNNPQFVPFMAIYIAGYALLYWRPSWRNLGTCALLISSLGVGYLVHAALVAWALGGWQNFVADILAALHRRTEGFAEAVELPFRQFNAGEASVYLLRLLNEMQALPLWRWIAMIALPPLLVLVARPRDMKARLREWGLGIVMLAGALAFIVVFAQAAVTQPLDILKTLMPAAGVLLGLCVRETVMLIREHRLIVAVPAAVVAAATVVPVLAFNVTGLPITEVLGGAAIKGAGTEYLGGRPAEIRRVGKFLAANTAYGDIVFAGFPTGDTGHPDYPNPAWEYLADRQIRVMDGVESWAKQIAKLREHVRGLPPASPFRKIHFFALIADDYAAAPAIVSYLRETAVATARMDADQRILGSRGYTLYRLDGEKAGAVPDSLAPRRMPSPATPWTDVLNSITRLESILPTKLVGGWQLSALPQPSLLHKDRPGLLHLYSTPEKPMSLRNETVKFRAGVGSTMEARFLVDRLYHSRWDAAMIALQDGAVQLKVTFSANKLTVRDGDTPVIETSLPRLGEFVTFRLALAGGRGYAYLDGRPLATEVTLQPTGGVGDAVMLGNLDADGGEMSNFDVDYVAYSNKGAFAPDGSRLKGAAAAVTPVDTRTPWTVIGGGVRGSEGWVTRNLGITHDAWVLSSARRQAHSHVERDLPDFDNAAGTTFEARARIDGVTIQNRVGAMMLLRDGVRELSISFFQDLIWVYDGARPIAQLRENAFLREQNTYRLALVRDCGYVFINGSLAFAGALRSRASLKGVQFGDFIPYGKRNFHAIVDHLTVSSKGAFAPTGQRLRGMNSPKENCQ